MHAMQSLSRLVSLNNSWRNCDPAHCRIVIKRASTETVHPCMPKRSNTEYYGVGKSSTAWQGDDTVELIQLIHITEYDDTGIDESRCNPACSIITIRAMVSNLTKRSIWHFQVDQQWSRVKDRASFLLTSKSHLQIWYSGRLRALRPWWNTGVYWEFSSLWSR